MRCLTRILVVRVARFGASQTRKSGATQNQLQTHQGASMRRTMAIEKGRIVNFEKRAKSNGLKRPTTPTEQASRQQNKDGQARERTKRREQQEEKVSQKKWRRSGLHRCRTTATALRS